MKCQILFSGKNKKNISKCCLLKILPRVLSVNVERDLKHQTIFIVKTFHMHSSKLSSVLSKFILVV